MAGIRTKSVRSPWALGLAFAAAYVSSAVVDAQFVDPFSPPAENIPPGVPVGGANPGAPAPGYRQPDFAPPDYPASGAPQSGPPLSGLGAPPPGPVPQAPPRGPGVDFNAPATPQNEADVSEIRIEGNTHVPFEKIQPHIRLRKGRAFDVALVESDVRALLATRLFISVKPLYETTPQGVVVIYRVVERPVLLEVKFLGAEKIKAKKLEKEVSMKAGDAVDPSGVVDARRKIEELYKRKGFNHVQVQILEGESPQDRRVVFQIHEGPRQRVMQVDFVGCKVSSEERLRTIVSSKPVWFWRIGGTPIWKFGGEYDPEKLDQDQEKLLSYYHGLGYWSVRIGREISYNADQSGVYIQFVIDEGPRFTVRDIAVVGNQKFSNDQVLGDMKLKANMPFEQNKLELDVNRLKDLYGADGHIFADVKPDVRFLEEPAKLDIVYQIDEGARYRVGRINVYINGDYPHTKITTVLNRISLRPGDIVDIRELRASERRIKAAGIFKNDPQKGVAPKIVFGAPGLGKNTQVANRSGNSNARGQDPGSVVGYVGGEPGVAFGALPEGAAPPPGGTLWQFDPRTQTWSPAPPPAPGARNAPGEVDVTLYEPELLPSTDDEDEPLPPPGYVPAGYAPRYDAPQGYAPQGGYAPAGHAPAVPPMGYVPPRPQSAPHDQQGFHAPQPGFAPGSMRPAVPQGQVHAVAYHQPEQPVEYAAQAGYAPAAPAAAPHDPRYVDPRHADPRQVDPRFAPSPQAAQHVAYDPYGATHKAEARLTAILEDARDDQVRLAASQRAGAVGQTVLHPTSNEIAAGPHYGRSAMRGQSPGGARPMPGGQGPSFTPFDVAPGDAPVYRQPLPAPNPPNGIPQPPPEGIPPGPMVPGTPGQPTLAPNGEPMLPGVGQQDWTQEPIQDFDVYVEETETGRIMFGVGVNSDAGVVGNIVIDEQNFDWRRPGTSFESWRNGTAFRGGGQRFRIEASPGSQVSRYVVNWTDPYFMDTWNSLGLSGSYYERFFTNWNERRTTGRVSVGRQITPDLSATFATRVEQVYLSNPSVPTPQELTDALGTTNLVGFRGGLIHDTRDSAFLPTEGHYIDLNFEQVVGDYTYGRGGVELRQYFLVRQRADGSGRHTLSLRGELGVTGSDTPIFDNYFAGGYTTLRGFQFRGASPKELNVTVGGEFLLLGSAEYMIPITADDMLKMVVFCDAGTVERDVRIDADNFRVAPGVGLRVTVPAMGPAPIAIDFAFPVAKADTDNTQVFNFYMGATR